MLLGVLTSLTSSLVGATSVIASATSSMGPTVDSTYTKLNRRDDQVRCAAMCGAHGPV